MKSKILIITMAIAVVASVFMGCSRNDKNTPDTTSSTRAAITDRMTTDNNGTSSTNGTTDGNDTTNGETSMLSEAESKADKVGDDLSRGADDLANGVSDSARKTGDAIKDTFE